MHDEGTRRRHGPKPRWTTPRHSLHVLVPQDLYDALDALGGYNRNAFIEQALRAHPAIAAWLTKQEESK